jgi:hypothetical protein
MPSIIRAVMSLTLLLAAQSSLSWAGVEGVDYVADADTLVYGGSHFWSRTQNPADVHILYAEPLRTRVRHVLHQSEGVLSDIQASPEGGLVAVVVRVWEENVSPQRATYVGRRVDERGRLVEAYYFEESKLVVLSLDGSLVDTISGVRRYAWDPKGRRIAYLTGNYREGGAGFESTGTWMYDLSSKEALTIHAAGRDVQWAGWDGKIYIYDPFSQHAADARVLRFDPETRELASTAHHGIYFSPDGKHYYAEGYGGTDLRVFQTQNDEQVPLDFSMPSNRDRIASHAAGWFDDATLIVPSAVASDEGDLLFDVKTRTVRSASGTVLPLMTRNNRALVLQGASVVEQSTSEFVIVQ